MNTMKKTKLLRKMLDDNDFLTLPGVYDCLSARIAEEAGFKAIFLSGGALAYSRLGRPDIGFLSVNEFSDAIANIAACVDIPLIADADNGFGNAIHAGKTARFYEQIGASGIQIDDKVLPGLHPNKNEIVEWESIAPKIKAMRKDVSDDFVIIFRTVANLYDYGVEEAISRINNAGKIGADYAYIDGIKTKEDLEYISEKAEIKLLINLNENGFCGKLPIEDIKSLNYKIGLFPISTMLSASKSMMEIMNSLQEEGSTLLKRDLLCKPAEIYNMMGLKTLTEEYSKLYD